jgi:hypothetical protein
MESKCPACQKGSISSSNDGLKIECSRCWFRCHVEHLPRIAAAMELARASVKRTNAHKYLREAWKISDEVSDLAREASEDADGEVKDATKRVLKVFGGE